MSLRKQVLVGIGIMLAGFIVVLCGTSGALLLRRFSQIEYQAVSQDVRGTLGALHSELDQLDTSLNDWSDWDDTYRFVLDRNQAYIASNLNDDTMRHLRLDLLVFAKPSGQITFAKCYDQMAGRSGPFPVSLHPHLAPGQRLTKYTGLNDGVRGLVSLSGRPLLVAARPILTSQRTGPSHGTLLMGRFLDPREAQRLSGRDDLSVHVHSLNASGQATSPVAGIEVVPVNSRLIAGRTTLRDVYGEPAALLEVTTSREMHMSSRTTMYYYLAALLIIGLLFGVAVELMIERIVLLRLRRLSRSVTHIGKSGDMSARVSVSGRDELAMLGGSVNDMLSALDASQTELRQQHALRDSEERYRALVELSPMAVIIHDEEKCVFANAAAAQLLGASCVEHLLGRNLLFLVHFEDRRRLFRHMRLLAGRHRSTLKFDGRLIRLDGDMIEVEGAGICYTFEGRPAVQFVARDITARKVYEDRLDYLAHHDHLTQLPNRMLFGKRLQHRISYARRNSQSMAVMFLDLDRFKLINDTLGHSVGDVLLVQVAARLTDCLTEVDTIARMGGDEFTVIAMDIASPMQPLSLAERALGALAEPFRIEGHELFISGSMGISTYPEDGHDVDALIKNADTAMYKAKQLGGNNCQLYTEDLSARTLETMKLEAHLRRALDRSEFGLYYQPRVSLGTGRVVGMEAVLRWHHPELGMIPPARFIPIAEETGLIVPIGEWVLHTACAQNKRWQNAGFPSMVMAVNVSGCQIRHGSLVDTVRRALLESGLRPEHLEMEITESTLMHNMGTALDDLYDIRAMGAHISVDDFGTGYSSLSCLKSLPISTIKIDQSFVQDITANPDSEAIAGAVVAMSRSLGLNVVAEGVETIEQLRVLGSLDCDEIQGFLISRPIPADEFTEFLCSLPHHPVAPCGPLGLTVCLPNAA